MVVTAENVQDQGLRAGVDGMAVEGDEAAGAVYYTRRRKKAQTDLRGERVASKEPCAGTVSPAEEGAVELGGARGAVKKKKGERAGTFSFAEEADDKVGGARRAVKKKKNVAVLKKKGQGTGSFRASGNLGGAGRAMRKKPAARRPEARTEFLGVSRTVSSKYGAQISRSNSKRVVRWLGTFDTAEEGARAYDAAAVELHGANAVTNFKAGGDSSGQATGSVKMQVKKPPAARPDARTEFRGVQMQKNGKYSAHVWDSKGKSALPLGTFGTAVEAARAYDAAAVELLGASAVTNFKASGELSGQAVRSVNMEVKKPPPARPDAWTEFRGVRRQPSGKYTAQIWDSKVNSALYLGCFDTDVEAARAFDAAALELRGASAVTNFKASSELSSEASGSVKMKVKKTPPARPDAQTEFRGVRRRPSGKYSARYLGCFDTAVEAAKAFDAAALKLHGASAVTNFNASGELSSQASGSVKMKVKKRPPARPDAPTVFRGVRRRPSGKYTAQIWDSKRKSMRYLGCFGTAEEAARAYNAAAVKLNGPATGRNFEQQPRPTAADDVEVSSMDLLKDFPELLALDFSQSRAYDAAAVKLNGPATGRNFEQQPRPTAADDVEVLSMDLLKDFPELPALDFSQSRAYDAAAVKLNGPAAGRNFEQQPRPTVSDDVDVSSMDLLTDFPELPALDFLESLIPGPLMVDLRTELPPAEWQLVHEFLRDFTDVVA